MPSTIEFECSCNFLLNFRECSSSHSIYGSFAMCPLRSSASCKHPHTHNHKKLFNSSPETINPLMGDLQQTLNKPMIIN